MYQGPQSNPLREENKFSYRTYMVVERKKGYDIYKVLRGCWRGKWGPVSC